MQIGGLTQADVEASRGVDRASRISIPAASWPLASVALGAAYAAVATWTLFYRHAHLHTSAFDFGLIAQTSWNSLHGRLFATTVLPFNYAAEHFAPSLVILSPLFLLWNDPRVLLVVGATAGGVAGVGLYAAARTRIGDPVAALIVEAAFLLAPATSWSVLDEFHPIVLALPAITFATALLWRGHLRWAAVVGGLALLANEDATMWVAPFGLLAAFVGWRRRRGATWGLALAALGVAWLAAYLLVITPLVRPPALGTRVPPPDVGAFSWCGNSVAAVSSCLLMHPVATARHLVAPGNVAAVRDLFLPTLGLGVLGPSFLVAVPRWLLMVLGNQPPGYKEHYVALLVAPAFLATAEAIGWLHRRLPVPPRALAALVAIASVVAYTRMSDLPGGGDGLYLSPKPDELARIALANQALSLIPSDPRVSVAATGSILPHVALRPRVYLLTEGSGPPADYRIFDLTDSYPISQDELRNRVALTRADPSYQVLFDRDPIVVLQHRYVAPAVVRADMFGGMIALDGYTVVTSAEQVRLTLFWRAAAPPDRDYHYFVHLVDPSGKGVGQQDGELAGGRLRTSQLTAGRVVRDAVSLAAPGGTTRRGSHLEVGWYDLGSGTRLTLPSGGDHVDLPL